MLKTNGKEIRVSRDQQSAGIKPTDPAPAEAAHEIPQHVLALLPEMLQAHEYAESLQLDPWDFAIELPMLCAMGHSISDLRWLTYRGYIQAADEMLPGARAGRAFRLEGTYSFTQETCFILTEAGQKVARFALAAGSTAAQASLLPPAWRQKTWVGNAAQGAARAVTVRQLLAPAPVPYWDPERHELWLDGTLVKQFKLPSPNQEAVLSAFEEEGWPKRIDDPLSRVGDLDPKQRLHDTIKSLNRHQKTQSLKFGGDGRGEGVLWEPLPMQNGNA